MAGYDIAVVGGGVIGLSCVLHLMEKDTSLKVVLVDAPTRPGMASRAAAGMLAPFAEFCQESELFHLCRAGYGYYQEFLDKLLSSTSRTPEIDNTGTLIPSNDRFAERAERIVAFAVKYSDVRELSGEELYEEEPLLRGGAVKSAFVIEGGMINPIVLHRAMRERAVQQGVVWVEDEVTNIVMEQRGSSRRAQKICLKDGNELEFDTLVLASGAWSSSIGKLLDTEIEIIPVKGQLGRFATAASQLRHVVHCHDIYLAPRPGRGVVFGATMEEVGFRTGVDAPTIDLLSTKAEDLVPSFGNTTVVESWYGFRPKFPDGIPAIGWAATIDNLLVATGHFRNGILLAPITGRIIADQFSSGKAERRDFYSPARLGL